MMESALVVGGNNLHYELDAGSPAAIMLGATIVANHVISDAERNARLFSCSFKDSFLAIHMQRPEYINIAWKYFPPDIITRYNLQEIRSSDRDIYCKIQKGIYGLKRATVLLYEELLAHL